MREEFDYQRFRELRGKNETKAEKLAREHKESLMPVEERNHLRRENLKKFRQERDQYYLKKYRDLRDKRETADEKKERLEK